MFVVIEVLRFWICLCIGMLISMLYFLCINWCIFLFLVLMMSVVLLEKLVWVMFCVVLFVVL